LLDLLSDSRKSLRECEELLLTRNSRKSRTDGSRA
jgi:hypothetical protein